MSASIKRMTFAGTSVIERGRQAVARQHSTSVSVRHIPGGDVNYVDIGGRTLNTVNIPVFFEDNNEFMLFQSLVGIQGSLNYSGGTFQAILQSASVQEILPDGSQTAAAEFLLL